MPACETLLLHPDRPTRLDAARHAELRVESGIVWITVDGVAGDLFVAAGERYRPPRRGRVLVEAVRGRARVCLQAPRRPLAVLAGWWRVLLPRAMAR